MVSGRPGRRAQGLGYAPRGIRLFIRGLDFVPEGCGYVLADSALHCGDSVEPRFRTRLST